ncbi:glycosyltransferase [Neobacillus sp. MER 74]|uniref:glycosyltransferase n=1 Tax=Neobacillus sp. MER 74 TaxID=2939566 RepID=UPI00203DB226|nr:glycosyltransferase [Neobacillus sp. MER 74]MCM3115087.1 glycosyltransferase [Neobacillus sp. MER 74]
MKKKDLLFVMPSLEVGGGERSLVNLLSQIDYNLFNVDLYLFSKKGAFLNQIPKSVNILELSEESKTFAKPLINSLLTFLISGRFRLAYSRFLFFLRTRIEENKSYAEQATWKYRKKSIDKLKKEYDAAIGYLEKSPIYFVIDRVKSTRKIGWIHTNYSNSGMLSSLDFPYFNSLDQIVTVSKECNFSINQEFPSLTTKVKVIENIVSPKVIKSLSTVEKSDIRSDGYSTKIITVARLSHEKGIDLAIQACKLLIDKGYKIKWFVLGNGSDREKLEKLIEMNNLKNQFILLGNRDNPYPYVQDADIYVQPSRYEGKSIAIEEAKILNKPIVITNFDTAKDQIINGENGLIVNITKEDLCYGVEKLMIDPSLKNKLTNNLSYEILGTVNEIRKFYEMIEGE